MKMLVLCRADQATVLRAVIAPDVKFVTSVQSIRPTTASWNKMGVRQSHVAWVVEAAREVGVKIAALVDSFPFLNVFPCIDGDVDAVLSEYGLKRG